jgi:PEP-CTERM motif
MKNMLQLCVLATFAGLTVQASAATNLGGIVSDHYTVTFGTYYSGGTSCSGVSSATSYDYQKLAPDPMFANQTDHYWMQGDTYTGITWDLGNLSNMVAAFGAIDHGPTPIEGYEFVLLGSNDLQNWETGVMEYIVDEGWVNSGASEESDDLSTIWSFANEYRYVRALANYDGDFEMDALGAATAVPEPTTMAALGLGLAGAKAIRRFKRR